jgi:hypothetical protein
MGTFTQTVLQRMDRFRQKQMKLENLTEPGWEDSVDWSSERDQKYWTWSKWCHICVNARNVPTWSHVSFFLISRTRLWEMILHLCMCQGRTHHVKGLEYQSGCKTTSPCDIWLSITDEWKSKGSSIDTIAKQNLSEEWHTSNWNNDQYSVLICQTDDTKAVFIHICNCITLCMHVMHTIEMLEMARATSWKSRRRN